MAKRLDRNPEYVCFDSTSSVAFEDRNNGAQVLYLYAVIG